MVMVGVGHQRAMKAERRLYGIRNGSEERPKPGEFARQRIPVKAEAHSRGFGGLVMSQSASGTALTTFLNASTFATIEPQP